MSGRSQWGMLLIVAVSAIYAEQRSDSLQIEIMSFNVRYGTAKDGKNSWKHRRNLVESLLNEHDPDLIGVQEALGFQLNEILEDCRWLKVIGQGRDDGKCAGEYAAILYRADRFKPDTSGTVWFSETPQIPGSRHWGNKCPRICTWARFKDRKTGKGLYIYNVHLDHRSGFSQRNSVLLLKKIIADRPHAHDPVILTGDFNSGPKSSVVKILTENDTLTPSVTGKPGSSVHSGLVDCTTKSISKTSGGTLHFFGGYRFGPRIDYIFVHPSIKVLDSRIIRTSYGKRYPSDHFPVSATIRLQK